MILICGGQLLIGFLGFFFYINKAYPPLRYDAPMNKPEKKEKRKKKKKEKEKENRRKRRSTTTSSFSTSSCLTGRVEDPTKLEDVGGGVIDDKLAEEDEGRRWGDHGPQWVKKGRARVNLDASSQEAAMGRTLPEYRDRGGRR